MKALQATLQTTRRSALTRAKKPSLALAVALLLCSTSSLAAAPKAKEAPRVLIAPCSVSVTATNAGVEAKIVTQGLCMHLQKIRKVRIKKLLEEGLSTAEAEITLPKYTMCQPDFAGLYKRLDRGGDLKDVKALLKHRQLRNNDFVIFTALTVLVDSEQQIEFTYQVCASKDLRVLKQGGASTKNNISDWSKVSTKLISPLNKVIIKLTDAKRNTLEGSGFLGLRLEMDESAIKIAELVQGQSAQISGLQQNDIILEIGHQSPKTIEDVKAIFFKLRPGQIIALKINRGGIKIVKRVVLAFRPSTINSESQEF